MCIGEWMWAIDWIWTAGDRSILAEEKITKNAQWGREREKHSKIKHGREGKDKQ